MRLLEWDDAQWDLATVEFLRFHFDQSVLRRDDLDLHAIGQNRSKRRKWVRGPRAIICSGRGFVRVFKVQLLLGTVRTKYLALCVIGLWRLGRTFPAAKIQVIFQPLCHGSVQREKKKKRRDFSRMWSLFLQVLHCVFCTYLLVYSTAHTCVETAGICPNKVL